MKKYGIFLGYAPEQSITNQGLGRLLAFIIDGALKENKSITLAYPKWYEKEILELCEDHNIDKNKLDIITTNSVPAILRIRNFLNKLTKKKQKTNFEYKIKKIVFRIFIFWVSIVNPVNFFLFSSFLITIFLVTFPILLLFFLSYFFKKLLVKLLKKSKIDYFFKLFGHSLKLFKNNLFAHKTYEKIREKEFKILIKKINQNKEIDAWLIPTIFWPEIKLIKAKKIVVVPDIILYDFPIHFNIPHFEMVNNNLHRVIACADQFITYSKYVKENHLIKNFSINSENISLIHHGFIDLSKYLIKDSALNIIQNYQMKFLKNDKYLANYDFEDIKFIFYSSQIRPHKNFINLLKAYKILLREKFINIKLIVTADLFTNPETKSFIINNRLQNDIIQLFNVPSNVLAALNCKAICSVNPTLFEGGFPFTFLEAYTVGTPSIMGDIPMTSELIEDENLKNIMLFNPYSVKDMVDKIEWGINNKELLFKKQEKLYLKMKERSWSDVAKDYIEVLENASK